MIKFRITDDEFNQYTETFSVNEFFPVNTGEFYTPKEVAPPPQENISIQEDAGNFGQQSYDQRTSDFHQDINRNTSENNQSEISSNNSASSNSSNGTGSESSGASSSSGGTSSTSSGANVTGGESMTAASSSTAAASGASASAASGATATAASIAGSVTVVAAAIVAIVVVAANIIKAAPTVIMQAFFAGTNYVSFEMNIQNLDPEVQYVLTVTNPNFEYTTELKFEDQTPEGNVSELTENSDPHEVQLLADGTLTGLVTGLTPNRTYKLQILSVEKELGGYSAPHFTYEFTTSKEKRPDAVSAFESAIDYNGKQFNLNYNIFISDAYKTGSNTHVDFYVGDSIIKTDSNIDGNGYIKGTLSNLKDKTKVIGIVKTTYYGEEIEIDRIEFNIVYPPEIITADAFMATYDFSYESSIGTSDTCYQYVYAINTNFNNSAQPTDMYKLDIVGANDQLLDTYTGQESNISLAVDYNQPSVSVYITPIVVRDGQQVLFDRQLLQTIDNPNLFENTQIILQPNSGFTYSVSATRLLASAQLTCNVLVGDTGTPIEETFDGNNVSVSGIYNSADILQVQLVDSTGKIAGVQVISLTETATQNVEFSASGEFDVENGYTVYTSLWETPTFADGEGYVVIIRDENNEVVSIGTKTTEAEQSVTIPDLTHIYTAALASTKTINGIQYVFENSAGTDQCGEEVFMAFSDARLMFDKEYSTESFIVAMDNIFTENSINTLATITNVYTGGATDSFNIAITAGLMEASNSMELTLSQWNTLVRTEVLLTDDNGAITYARFTYTKASTSVDVDSYDVSSTKKLILTLDTDCPESGIIDTVSFTDSSSGAVISDPIVYQANKTGEDWTVTIEELRTTSFTGSWSYTINDNGYYVQIDGYYETDVDLNVTATVMYYLEGEGSHTAEDECMVYVDGYPTINGKEVNLSNWSLAFYSDSEFTENIQLSNEEYSIGAGGISTYTLLSLMDPVSTEFYYKMTYGLSGDVLASNTLSLPNVAYDESTSYEDQYNPSCYGTYPSNAVTFNLEGTRVASTNIYNTYKFTTEDSGIYYVNRIAYSNASGYEVFRSYIDEDHPYIALEDLPYQYTGYNTITYAYKKVTLGGVEYNIYLGEVYGNNQITTMIVDGSLNAVYGLSYKPSFQDDGSSKYIDMNTVADHLVEGNSVDVYIGGSTEPTMQLNPRSVLGTEYATPDYEQSVDGYNVIILNHKANLTDDATVAIQIIFDDYNVDATGTRVVARNKVRNGSTELAEYNITVKGYVFALQSEQYTLYDDTNTPVQFTAYTLGDMSDSVYLYAIDSEVTLITEFANIA